VLTLQPQFVVGWAFMLVGACSGLARSSPVRPMCDVLCESDQGLEYSIEQASYFVAGQGDEVVVLIGDPLFSSAVLMIVRNASAIIESVMCLYQAV
jgi:hypothetical protein